MKKQSRKNIPPSYAEKFFMNGIKMKFRDKNYVREHPIDIFYADFCWIRKKKVIEIDSSFHLDSKDRDKYKDKILKKKGWKVLRLEWKKILKNPKLYLRKADNFIMNP